MRHFMELHCAHNAFEKRGKNFMTRLLEERSGYTPHWQISGEVMVIEAGVPLFVSCVVLSHRPVKESMS